ncbi:MAG: PAS domain S-box protein [Gammaproteobacteria bacterium]|nr:PAS domain S-box protein [Gammaproteobacteria bacterium]
MLDKEQSSEPFSTLFSTEHGGIWLVAVIGLGLSLAALLLIQQQLEAHKMLDFEWVAHNRIRALDHGIDNSLRAMLSMRDLYAASEKVNPDEFQVFAQPLLQRHPGIQALLWVPRITDPERDEFERSQSNEDQDFGIQEAGPHFDLVPAINREEYLPVSYVAPATNRDFAVGFDLASNPTFASLLARSRESGHAAASKRIGFPGKNGGIEYGFLVSLPIFRHRPPIEALQEQDDQLQGFVIGLFRLSGLARAAIAILEPRGVEVLLLDETAAADQQFLHFYASRLSPRIIEASNYSDWMSDEDEPRVAERIKVADREWSIVCGRTNHFRSAEAFDQGPWVALLGGLLFTLLLSVYLVRIRENILERITMEQQLMEREELFRQMTETVDEVFWATSADGRELIYLSPAYQQIVGLSEQGEGISLLDVVYSEDRQRFLGGLRRIERGNAGVEVIHRLQTVNRSLRWIRTRGFPVRNKEGEVYRLVGYSEDITERKAADEALRESEAILRDLFQQSPDIIMTVDKRGKILLMNRSILELPADRAIGRNSLALMPSDFRKWYRRALKAVFQDTVSKQFQYSTDDGVYWEGRIVPIHSEGPVIAAMVIATDVTEKRNLETQSLRNARLASIGVLAAGVAHEINNPNNAIQFNASMVTRAWRDITPILNEYYEENGDFALGGLAFSETQDTLPQLLTEITRNTQRIKRIVGNLKHMARQDAGELSESVDIQQVLESSVMLLHNQIQKHTDVCSLNVQDDLPMVKGNSQQLEQVFINVLLNALQSLPNRKKGVFVTAFFNPDTQTLSIQVRDEGQGVSERNIGRLSEPFFTTRTDTGGTGLGLSISRSIIEKHKGNLTFKSELGIGTLVTICLPATSLS